MKKLETIAKDAEELTHQLLEMNLKAPRCPDGFPQSGGVYCIRNIKDEVLYIGKAKNIRRRICRNHINDRTHGRGGAFRRSVHTRYQIPFGPEMKDWIISNCRFSCIEIPDADMRSVVESLAIAFYRSDVLLNKP